MAPSESKATSSRKRSSVPEFFISYTGHYSQAKYRKAMDWLRQQRARLIAGTAMEEPELSRQAAIRTIHVFLSKRKLSSPAKLAYYAALAERFGITPPFQSSKICPI